MNQKAQGSTEASEELAWMGTNATNSPPSPASPWSSSESGSVRLYCELTNLQVAPGWDKTPNARGIVRLCGLMLSVCSLGVLSFALRLGFNSKGCIPPAAWGCVVTTQFSAKGRAGGSCSC